VSENLNFLSLELDQFFTPVRGAAAQLAGLQAAGAGGL